MRQTLIVLAISLPTFALACGQDVPTCESDCTAIGEPEQQENVDTTSPASAAHFNGCSATCSSDQSNATANGHAADFQSLLTCVGNAGSFAAECAPLACGLTSAFGPPSGCGAVGGGK